MNKITYKLVGQNWNIKIKLAIRELISYFNATHNFNFKIREVEIGNDPKSSLQKKSGYCYESGTTIKNPSYHTASGIAVIGLKLNLKKVTNAEVVYQLTHELIHHMIREYTGNINNLDAQHYKSFAEAYSIFTLYELGFKEYSKKCWKDIKNNNSAFSKYKDIISDLIDWISVNLSLNYWIRNLDILKNYKIKK